MNKSHALDAWFKRVYGNVLSAGSKAERIILTIKQKVLIEIAK